MTEKVVQVGVGVYIVKNGKVLIGKRKAKLAFGTYAAPGGHLEFGETPIECAIREAKEETGLDLKKVFTGPYATDLLEGKHYITLSTFAVCPEDQEPQVLEPDKLESWFWADWNEIPEPQMISLVNFKKLNVNPVEFLNEKLLEED